MRNCHKLVSLLPHIRNEDEYLSVLFSKQHICTKSGLKNTACRAHKGATQYESTEPYSLASCTR